MKSFTVAFLSVSIFTLVSSFAFINPSIRRRSGPLVSGVVNCEVNEDALGIKKQSSMMENTTESRTDRIRKLKFESNPQETSCFIGNLDFSITEGDILTLCNKLLGEGVATRVRLALDKETGRLRGFCHVDFRTTEQAQRAISVLTGAHLMGRELRIGYSKKRDDPAAANAGGVRKSVAGIKHSVFLGNLSWDVTGELLKKMLDDLVGTGTYTTVRLALDRDSSRPKGYAHVDFRDAESAERAVAALNNLEVLKRKIRADLAQRKSAPLFKMPISMTAAASDKPVVAPAKPAPAVTKVLDHAIATIETDKVNVEVRTPTGGKITKLLSEQGDEVNVGKPVMELEASAEGAAAAHAAPAVAPKTETPKAEATKTAAVPAPTPAAASKNEAAMPAAAAAGGTTAPTPTPTPEGAPMGTCLKDVAYISNLVHEITLASINALDVNSVVIGGANAVGNVSVGGHKFPLYADCFLKIPCRTRCALLSCHGSPQTSCPASPNDIPGAMAFLAAKAMEAEQEAEFKQQEERFNTCLRDLLAAFKFHCVTPALRAYTGDYSLNLNSYLAGANNDAEIKFLRALPPDDPRKEALRFRNPPKDLKEKYGIVNAALGRDDEFIQRLYLLTAELNAGKHMIFRGYWAAPGELEHFVEESFRYLPTGDPAKLQTFEIMQSALVYITNRPQI